MCKQEFLAQLKNGLSCLSEDDIAERLTFYSEMIDDRMDEGLSEEEAVAAAGSVEEIVAQIIADTPSETTKKTIPCQKRQKTWIIVLLVLGSPVWLSLVISAAAVILSLYISVWSVIVSLWAVFGSLVGCSFGGLAAGILFTCSGNGLPGVAVIAGALVCAGLSIFLFYGCKAATKGILTLTKHFAVWTKNRFIGKEKS